VYRAYRVNRRVGGLRTIGSTGRKRPALSSPVNGTNSANSAAHAQYSGREAEPRQSMKYIAEGCRSPGGTGPGLKRRTALRLYCAPVLTQRPVFADFNTASQTFCVCSAVRKSG
jgi:hypothetical protein